MGCKNRLFQKVIPDFSTLCTVFLCIQTGIGMGDIDTGSVMSMLQLRIRVLLVRAGVVVGRWVVSGMVKWGWWRR